MVNNEALRDYHISKQKGDDGGSPRRAHMNGGHSAADPIVVSIDEEEDLVDSDDEESSSPILSSLHSDRDAFNLSQFFIVDSFNIHRLVIAGVTCASKFFSDVFYTNSRYAKVRDGVILPLCMLYWLTCFLWQIRLVGFPLLN